MFNQEIKERYIQARPASMTREYNSYFAGSEQFENKFGKDVAEFTAPEIDELFRSYGFLEPDTVRNRLARFSSYAAWYQENIGGGLNCYKGYDVSTFPFAEYFNPTLIRSPELLCNMLRQVYDADSGQPVLAALCFAWLGIESGDAVLLRKEQVDAEHGKIFDQTGAIIVNSMPDCIRDLLYVYSKTQSATRVQNQTFTVYAEDIGYFMKRMKSANSEKKSGPYSKAQMTVYLAELRAKFAELYGEEAATPLNYSNVLRSGRFYRLHELAKSGVDVRSTKNADKVRLCLGSSKRNHKDNMLLYDAYLECIGEK